jgi:hypothetical protein
VLVALFGEGEELIGDGRFLDALNLLKSPQAFCETVGERFPCPEKLVMMQTMAHNGMFRSFITVSERALASDNLGFCVTYLRSALEYQEAYSGFVTDTRAAVRLLQRVVSRHIARGATLWLEGDSQGANAHFEAAENLCAEFDYLQCDGVPVR